MLLVPNIRGVLILLAVFGLAVSSATTCTSSSNIDYTSDGDMCTLYGVTSADQCCQACGGIEECKYYVWRSSNSQCFVKTKQSNQTTGSGTVGGANQNYNYVRNVATSCVLDTGYEYVYSGKPLGSFTAASASACCSSCQQYVGCNYYKYVSGTCYLQSSKGVRKANSAAVSGTVLPDYSGVTPRTGKRGLGVFGTTTCSDIKLMSKASWAYNWAGQPGALEPCFNQLGIEFVPMLWGLTSNLNDLYTKSKYLLTYNEPNFGDQSNMTPAQAAAQWPAIQSWAAQYGMQISSPSASYGGSNLPDAIAWLDQFFGNCTGCKVDFIATHQYDCNGLNLYYATTNFKKYNKPVWVTEFGCFQTNFNGTSWASQVLPKFDGDSGFARYSYFGFRGNGNYEMLDPTKSALTTLGTIYNS